MTPDWNYSDPCVIEGRPMKNGYSRINVEGERVYAHRHAWERVHGPIPRGMYIHHRCHNRRCSSVEHLELVSPAEHSQRHPRPRPEACRKCGETQWYEYSGSRFCATCFKQRHRDRYATDAAYRERRKQIRRESYMRTGT